MQRRKWLIIAKSTGENICANAGKKVKLQCMPDWISKTNAESIVETHISWVFLTGRFAYKVKKPVDFGFCNFSTLELRRKFCERELAKNRALCPDVYLDVLPVYFDGRRACFGIGAGELIDYCVKMKRLPEERKMSGLLDRDAVSKGDILKIARTVREFHDRLPVSPDASKYGCVENIRRFCEQNFEQVEVFGGKAVLREDLKFVAEATRKFLAENEKIFTDRFSNVKDCHGDLHSGNIFLLENGDVKIFDALEFNPALSTTDVLSDVAFMAMDLDFHGCADFAEEFVETYGEKDSPLLNFYKCYRAFVRGKVGCLSGDFEVAGKYFDLAGKYADML